MFGLTCPSDPTAAGYKGECEDGAEDEVGDKSVAERTWYFTSRVTSDRCRNKLGEVYCAYVFNKGVRTVYI